MTAPYSLAGFPETQEIVSGEPVDDPGKTRDVDTDNQQRPKSGKSIQSIGKGFWLEGEPDKVARDIDLRWNAQNKAMKTGLARGDLNEKRRSGDPYSKLVKDTDADTYRVYTPRGIEQAPPSLNKTDDLCVKVVSNLLVDPPKPECEPASDSDEDRSSAEFSTRVLMNESTESGLNIPDLVRDAEDLACSWGSGYVVAYVDPQGGGHRPKEIMAPPGATQVGPDGQPVLEMPGQPDPVTGAPGASMPITGEPMIRYVAEDGVTITDDPSQAMLEWLPKLCADVVTRKHLRFLPETCTGIRDADGILLAAFEQLGNLKAQFPSVAAMKPDELQALVNYRPEIAKVLLPKHAGNGEGTRGPDYDSSKGPPDDAMVLTITGIRRGSMPYPLGAYVVSGGQKFVLHREEWAEEIPGKNGAKIKRAMDINVAQFRQFRDTRTGDPHGRGLVDRVGDGDPLVSFAIGAIVEYLHRVNNPHLFVPIGSGIQAKSLQLPRGTPIPYNPSGGGVPKQEEIAPLPTAFMDFIQFVRADQDSTSGLEQAAQGAASPSVQSGKHAQQIIEQALVALSGTKADMESGFQRLCRIVLQLIRKYYTTPQRIKIVGEDGAFKEREWMNTDLGSTTDVKIMAGTSTMLAASAKSAIALEKLQVGAITIEDFQRAETGNVRALIGAQDNPHKQRIGRQIADWKDGPPEDWQPQVPPADPLTGQPMLDPTTGQPVPPPVDPANPFADVRTVDQEQAVAIVRHAELARAQGGSKYKTKPPEWRAFFDAEYEAMRRAAGVATVAEQQMAAQQAAQQPQQMAEQQQQADTEKAEQEQSRQAEEAEKQRQVSESSEQSKRQDVFAMEDYKAQKAMEMEERKHQMALEAKQMDAQLAAQTAANAPAPAAAPQQPSGTFGGVTVAPPDLTAITEALSIMQQTLEVVANKEIPAPIVHVEAPPAPIVHVPAPVVHVEAPVVKVPAQLRPQVTVEAPREKPMKRRGTITAPDGTKYEVTSEPVDSTDEAHS
jgi:hypothetical protein